MSVYTHGQTLKAFAREAFDTEYAAIRVAPPEFRKVMLAELVRKAAKYDSSKHPRDDSGRFVSKDAIQEAASDPKRRQELERRVTDPDQREKLNAAIADQGGTVGRTKRGEARHQAGQRRATREEAKAKTAGFLKHLGRVGDLKAELTADDLHDLADHLGDPHVTLDDVRAMRHALAGAGAGRASFGGAKAKADMVKALQAHAKKAAFEARMREHGIGGADAEDMRAAAGLGAKEETPAPAPAVRTPPATGGQYGAWGRAAAGEATPPEPQPAEPAPEPKPAEPAAAKEPWEMTRKEWASADGGKFAAARRNTHITHVLDAAAAGKPIPDAVRKEYRKHLADAEKYNAAKRAEKETVRQAEAARESASAAAINAPETVTAEQYARIPNADAHQEWTRRAHNFGRYVSFGEFLKDRHRSAVESALAAGKPVPPEVLADYPDFAGSAPPPPAPPPAPEVAPASPADKPVRFEAGKKLTPAERDEVLRSVRDVYRENGLKKDELKGYHRDSGDPIYGYPHAPEHFVRSDVTGAKVRHYVTLPDGRKAHPSELFPQIKQSDIDRHHGEQDAAARDKERRAQAKDARAAATKGDANAAYNVTRRPLSGSYFARHADGRIARVDGTDPEDVQHYRDRGFVPITEPLEQSAPEPDLAGSAPPPPAPPPAPQNPPT